MNSRDPRERLAGELHWLDLVLLADVVRLRRSRPRPADQFQGLYIADVDVDHLLATALGPSDARVATESDRDSELLLRRLIQNAEEVRAALDAAAQHAGAVDAPLDQMVKCFSLSHMERGILLVGCAPDLEPRFETLFAYVQDDVTRRRPTSGLALRLLCDDPMERWLLRAMLQADAPLVRHGLVRLTEEQPFLSRVLRAGQGGELRSRLPRAGSPYLLRSEVLSRRICLRR